MHVFHCVALCFLVVWRGVDLTQMYCVIYTGALVGDVGAVSLAASEQVQ